MLKNITLSAEQALIERSRQRAARDNTTLNAVFRQWLAHYAEPDAARDYDALCSRLNYCDAGGTFSRDDLNDR